MITSPFGTSVDGKCSSCGEDLNGSDWPDGKDSLLCQMCWEHNCSLGWWEMYNSIAKTKKLITDTMKHPNIFGFGFACGYGEIRIMLAWWSFTIEWRKK